MDGVVSYNGRFQDLRVIGRRREEEGGRKLDNGREGRATGIHSTSKKMKRVVRPVPLEPAGTPYLALFC